MIQLTDPGKRSSRPRRLARGAAYQRRGSDLARGAVPYTFVAPKLALFIAFMMIPLVWTIMNAFQSGSILGAQHFVGFGNFTSAVRDPEFQSALENSLYYAVFVIPITIGVAMCLAGLLNRKIRFRPLFSILLIIPTVGSTVAASLIWDYLTLTNGGLFNTVLGYFGIAPVNWLGSPALVIPIFIALEAWRGVGFYTMLFLAGMQNIPRNLYDAASLDGVVGLRAFWKITVPLLRPTIMFAVIMATIWNLQLFDSPFVLTNGGPGYSSMTIVLYIYNEAFSYDNMGLASAMAIVLLLVIAVITALQFRIFRRDLDVN